MTSGREALKIFHDTQVKLYKVTYSLDEMIAQIGPKWFPDSLTTAFEFDDNLTPSRINKAMVNLAILSGGKIPKNYQVFNQALSDQVQSFDFKAFTDIADETIKDTVKVAQVAVAGYSTYKMLALLIPIAIFLLNKKGK